MRKILRQDVVTLPKQSLTGMKVALGVRAQYMTLIALSVLMVTQIIGVAIFSGNSQAAGNIAYTGQFASDQSHFSNPQSTAVDGSGNIYVLDGDGGNSSVQFRVVKLDNNRNYLSEWSLPLGEGGTSIAIDGSGNIFIGGNGVKKYNSNGTTILAEYTGAEPTGGLSLTVDSAGNIYTIGDNKILKLTNNLVLATTIGSAGSANGQLNSPYSITLDATDNLYVGDLGNGRIQKFNSSGGYVSKFSFGSAYPLALGVDTSGNIYNVSQSTVVKYNSAGIIQTTWGSSTSSGTSCLPGSMIVASSLAVDRNHSDTLYITDLNTSRVQVFSSSGAYQTDIGRCAPGHFSKPGDMVKDASGNIYVADNGNHRIQKLDSSGIPITSWSIGDPGVGNKEFTSANVRLAIGPSGNLYVSNYGHGFAPYTSAGVDSIFVYDSNGNFLRRIHDNSRSFSVSQQNGPPLAVDSNENLYACYYDESYYGNTSTMVKIDSSTGADLATWAVGTGCGYHTSLTIDSSDFIYVYNGNVAKYTTAGILQTSFGVGSHTSNDVDITDDSGQNNIMVSPYIAVASDGSIFVTSNHNIEKLTQDGRSIAYFGTAGTGNGQFGMPGGIALAGNGDVYVSELLTTAGTASSRIQKFHDTSYDPPLPTPSVTTRSAGNITQTAADLYGTIYDNANILGGTYGFEWGPTTSYGNSSNDNGAVSIQARLTGGTYGTGAGQIKTPRGMAIDSQGNVYVADSTNHKVLKYNPSMQVVLDEIGGPGGGDGQFDVSMAVAVDSHDDVYVTDYYATVSGGQTRIQKFDSDGTFLLKWGSQGTGNSQFQGPSGIAVDSNDDVYVLDAGNNRIQKFHVSGGTATYVTQWGGAGSGNSQFNQARGIAVGLDDTVYVADFGNNRIQRFDSDGNFLQKWGSNGTGDGQFQQLGQVTVDKTGTVYAEDVPLDGSYTGGRLSMFTADGVFITKMATSMSNVFPEGLVIGKDGSIIVSSIGSGTARLSTYARTSSIAISSLTCGTTYHFRSKATVRGVNYYGDDQTFATSACDPDPDPGSNFQIDTTSFSDAWTDHGFGQSISTSGGTGQSAFTLSDGVLPPGLNLQSEGYLSGTPTSAGTYNFTLHAVNGSYSDDQTYQMVIHSFRISNDSLPDGEVGQSYSVQLQTEDGKGSLDGMGIDSGSLPPGLYLDSQGLISGTPTTAGTYTFTVFALDSQLWTPPATREYQVTIAPQQSNIQITTDSLSDGYVDSWYSDYVQMTGSSGFIGFDITDGQLPPGVTLDSSGYLSGNITDISAANHTYTFTVRATDSLGSATKELEIYVNPLPELDFSGSTLNYGTVDQSYYSYLSASGGFGYKEYTLVGGSLPSGLSLDTSGGIMGTPDAPGNYTFTVRVSDLSGSKEAEFSIQINPAPVVEPRTNTPFVSITSPANQTVFDHTHDTVTVIGKGPANKMITAYMDGQELGTVMADGSGNWVYVAHDVFPGNHSFTAKWIPAGDLAFVPYMDNDDFSNIAVIDTDSQQLVKTLYLPEGVGAIAAVINRAGDKLYASGLNYDNYGPYLLEIDLSSGNVTRTISSDQSPGYFGPLIIDSTDKTAYVAVVKMESDPDNALVEYHKIDLSTFTDTGVWAPLYTVNYQDESIAYAAMLSLSSHTALTDGALYTPLSITDDADPQTISVINTTNGAIDSIALIDEARWPISTPLLAGGGGKIYTATNNKIVEIDPDTNTKTKEINVPQVVLGENMFTAFTVNSQGTKAYALTYAHKLLVIDIANETVDEHDLIDDAGNDMLLGMRLTSDGSKLYIPNSYSSTVMVFNTDTEQFESSITGALPEGPEGYALGDFVGHTIAPSATVAFTVQKAPVVQPPTDQPPVTPDPPTITDVTPPPSTPARVPTKTSPISAPQTTIAAQNSLFALAKRIPEPWAIGFPWFLLALALILVSIQYYQVHTESTATKRMQTSVAKQERLVEEQNNFVALSTHYLHTPLTVMEGEISLMVKAGTLTEAQATKLKATLTSLNAEAEAVLAQEEQGEVE